MRREIQVHFENQGQLQWHEDIDDVEEWMDDILSVPRPLVHDKESGRWICFDHKTIVAIIVTDKIVDDVDIFRRTYATQEGNEQENNQQQYQSGSVRGQAPETGRGDSTQHSTKIWRKDT